MMIQISPSMLSCDFAQMGRQAQEMEQAGADLLHLDVMDGNFVPNLTFGAPVIRCLRKVTRLPFDVHLMIREPLKYVKDFVNAGADLLTFHLESDSDALQTIQAIHSYGIKAGVAIKPGTPAQEVLPYLEQVEMVLVMTVEPGFGGQSFRHETMEKLSFLHQEIVRRGLQVDLQVDGGIGNDTAKIAVSHGANILVAGSALFSQQDYRKAVADLRSSALSAQ